MPENPEGHQAVARSGGAEPGGAGAAEEAGIAGHSETEPCAESAREAIGAASDTGERTVPAGDDDPGYTGGNDGGGDSEETRPTLPAPAKKTGFYCRVPVTDLARALMEAKGNVPLAAKAIGVDVKTMYRRIKATPELNAIYGNRGEDDVVLPPGPLETSLRTMQDEPPVLTDEDNRKMVEETERLIHQGLETVGVAPETINKIRTLRGMNIMGGQIIAQSLSDVYQLYYIDLMNIPARRAEIRTQFLTNPECTGMEKMFWQRADAELLEMMGKGLDRFLSGTQAMLAMERGKKKAGQNNAKMKPGW